jgi:hypothetical protein
MSEAFREDKLNREKYAEFLIEMIKDPQTYKVLKDNKSFILAVDSTWGTGKTTFIDMLGGKIKKEYPDEYVIVPYNAWKNDFSKHPLETLIYEIYQIIDGTNISKELKKDLKEAIIDLSKVTCSLVIGNERTNIIADGLKKIINAFKHANRNQMEEYFKNFKEERSSIDKFKTELAKVTQEIKIVIIIDELDRCRPDFSIELLEIVKHIFDVPNLIFIFSLDIEGLSKGIEKIYGNINGTGYLCRFFDYISKMPKPDRGAYIRYLVSDNDKDLGINIEERRTHPNNPNIKFSELFVRYSNYFNLSLRDIEMIYKNFSIFEIINFKNMVYCAEAYSLYLFFLIVKYKYSDAYANIFSTERLDKEQFIDRVINEGKLRERCFLKLDELRLDSIQRYTLINTSFKLRGSKLIGKIYKRNNQYRVGIDEFNANIIEIDKQLNLSGYIFACDLEKWEDIQDKKALQYIQEQLEFFNFENTDNEQ